MLACGSYSSTEKGIEKVWGWKHVTDLVFEEHPVSLPAGNLQDAGCFESLFAAVWSTVVSGFFCVRVCIKFSSPPFRIQSINTCEPVPLTYVTTLQHWRGDLGHELFLFPSPNIWLPITLVQVYLGFISTNNLRSVLLRFIFSEMPWLNLNRLSVLNGLLSYLEVRGVPSSIFVFFCGLTRLVVLLSSF